MRIELKTKLERNVKLAYLSDFITSLTFIIPIWFAFETKYATATTLGLIYAMNHLILVALELPSGAVADMLGRKKTVIAGLFVQGMAWVFLSQTRSEIWLWIGYAGDAMGIALVSGAYTALVYDSLKELKREGEYAKYSSRSAFILRIGLAVATMLGGFVFGINNRLPYFLTGLTTIISGAVLILATEPLIDTEKFSLLNYWKKTKMGMHELVKNSYIKFFSIYYLLVGGVTWYFLYFLNIAYATEVGFSEHQRSVMFGAIYLLSALINVLVVKWSWSHKTILWMFPVLIVVGYGLGGIVNPLTGIAAIFMVQLAGAARFSLLDQMANDEIESQHRATALSALNMLVSLVYAVLSIAGGKVIDSWGAPMLMLVLSIVSAFLILPMTIRLIEENK